MKATVVVVPRERFSFARRSLESIYEHGKPSFELIYVDAGSPRRTKSYLEEKAKAWGFQLIRSDRYLSPNQARNLGLRQVKTRYVVFIDNDILVKPGWLEKLVACADDTGASIVGPLYLQGGENSQVIHMAGGLAHIREEDGERILYEEDRFGGLCVSDLVSPLKREQSELVEFHCMLVSTDVFERLGHLDEQLLSLREHHDLCLAVRKQGGSVWIEPDAVVTYIPPPPLAWSDLPYFRLRWSEEWNIASLRRFHEKWNLRPVGDDAYLIWSRQRRFLFLKPFHSLQKLTRVVLGDRYTKAIRSRLLKLLEKPLNYLLNSRHPKSDTQDSTIKPDHSGSN
jgi:GT2 family glycosyltransferase